MEWLADNWLIFLVIGVVWFLCLGRGTMGCCGGGHSHGGHKESPDHEGHQNPTSSKGTCH